MFASIDPPLPKLRQDLSLTPGPTGREGEQTWLIYDALNHRYFSIDSAAKEVLSIWSQCSTVEGLVKEAQLRGSVGVDRGEIIKLIAFLNRSKLCLPDADGAWKILADEQQQSRQSVLHWLAHNYLFFRVPVWKPQTFLLNTLPVVRRIVNPTAIVILTVIGLLGLYLVSRQWGEFVATLQYAFTWEGVAITFLTLAFVKAAHEMGHAYMATHYGCRVPTMGLAFMLLTPMLYTDVSDASRLEERKPRVLIALAGIMVEFAVAAIALFLWAFMPEGPLRSAAFFLSAVSLITSLAINLNPFMRFDGYYVLADCLGIENLQSRSFELARWKLREWLFALNIESPECFSRWQQNYLITYAWLTWIYRVILYTGIAFVVYHFFFKALGVALFVFEIAYFVASPFWSELKCWYSCRSLILKSSRSRITAVAMGAAVVLLVFPWSTRVEMPAIVEPTELARVYPARAARVAEVRAVAGQSVAAGDVLVRLDSAELDRDVALAETKLRLARMQHARRLADATDREASLEIEGTIASLTSRIEGLRREKDELLVRAPISGAIVELNPDLHAGRSISPMEMLVAIGAQGKLIARGYVAEAEAARVVVGASGVFVPDAAGRQSLSGALDEVGVGSAAQIDILDLASIHGGRIAVQQDDKRRLVPVTTQYPVRFSITVLNSSTDLINRGVIVMPGSPESLIARVWRQMATVLVRESGF